jgi:glycosyltransferase involved in cell wall biosynthesis
MEDRTRATVVIPTYRRAHLLRKALESLAAQQTDYTFEVVVVNDAPDEDLSPLETEFSDISMKLITPPRNVGRGIARNIGVRNSSGEILIFMDDDMTAHPQFINAHVRAHTGAGLAVVGNIVSAPEYASHPLARYVERQGAKKRKGAAKLPPRVFRTGNGSVLRDLFMSVGMFDESFSTYGEDLDLAMRLEYHGAKFVFVEEAVTYNHYPPDIDDMLEKVREWGGKTMPILAESHPELERSVHAHLAHPVRLGRENLGLSLKKIAIRFALLPPFYHLARLVYKMKFLGPLLFPVIDYLRLYCYFGAYRSTLTEMARRRPEA